MNFAHFIGIDISKQTLDVCVLDEKAGQVALFQIKNSQAALIKMAKELAKKHVDVTCSLICAEHTGVYGNHLRNWSEQAGLNLWLEQALQIKRSQGLKRGKSDAQDAYRISMYCFTHWREYKPAPAQSKSVLLLKELMAQRKRLMKTKSQLTQVFKTAEFYSKETINAIKKGQAQTIKALNADIKAIDQLIEKTIDSDPELARLSKLVRSVKGIGVVSTCMLLVTTNAFKNFTDAKKYACYAGLVPFEHSSGTSIKSKAKVSAMANKKAKSILHMAAMSAARLKGELREFYLRKLAAGKNKMSVLNAVRNKLVLRVFACVKENRLYEENPPLKLILS